MGELADALELLHDAAARVRTLTGTLVEWFDEERMSRAADAYARRHRGSVGVLRASNGEPSFRQYELRTLVRYAAPNRYRLVQQASDYAHRPGDLLVVCDGEREWTYDAAGRHAYVQSPSRQHVSDLIDPSWLAAAYVLTVRGRSTHEGRPVIELHAVPRTEPAPSERHNITIGVLFADELDAVIDARTGLLVTLASHFDGAPYAIKKLTEVDINPSIGDELFSFTPPPGVRVDHVETQPRRPPWRLRLQARYHLARIRRRLPGRD